MIQNNLQEGSEIYIKRSDAHKVSMNDLRENYEYHPCDENNESCIIIKNFKYSIAKNENKLEICVLEDVSPKYWDKEYSARLWFDSYIEAIEKNEKCIKIFKDIDPHHLMSVLFYFELEIANYGNLAEAIEAADDVLREIENETKYIIKRSLIKFINK